MKTSQSHLLTSILSLIGLSVVFSLTMNAMTRTYDSSNLTALLFCADPFVMHL